MIGYLDCVGGIAGDMLLAACLDAGADPGLLERLPEELGVTGVATTIERVVEHGISSTHVDVLVDARDDHRTWREIRELLVQASLEDDVKGVALEVFSALARAEAKVHDVDEEDVVFHELGGEDTLVDVCGAVLLLRDLGVDRLICSPLPLGRGTTRSAHGVLPLPAPATVELLRGVPVVGVGLDGELVTPTGAALACTLAESFGPLPPMCLDRSGYGAGTASFAERPNLLRLMLGQPLDSEPMHSAVLLETNLDDFLPELIPDAVERCFAAGALDVWTTPVQMKKGRPGVVFSALSRPDDQERLARAILQETSALGVRVTRAQRYELHREERSVRIDGHVVRIKLGRLDGRVVNVAPEHDDCAAVARETGRPVKAVWAAALLAAQGPN